MIVVLERTEPVEQSGRGADAGSCWSWTVLQPRQVDENSLPMGHWQKEGPVVRLAPLALVR